MHLQTVGFQRTSLSERLLAEIALVRSDTCVCPGVALQVKGVIEALSAEGAEIALGVAVALHVPVQQSLQGELLGAYPALELGRVRVGPHRGQLLLCLDHPVRRQRVLESVAAVDQLDGGVRRNAELRGRNR